MEEEFRRDQSIHMVVTKSQYSKAEQIENDRAYQTRSYGVRVKGSQWTMGWLKDIRKETKMKKTHRRLKSIEKEIV